MEHNAPEEVKERVRTILSRIAELEKERETVASLREQQSEAASNLELITGLKEMAEKDARAALIDSHGAMEAMKKAQLETQAMQREVQELRTAADAAKSKREQTEQWEREVQCARATETTLVHEMVHHISKMSGMLRALEREALEEAAKESDCAHRLALMIQSARARDEERAQEREAEQRARRDLEEAVCAWEARCARTQDVEREAEKERSRVEEARMIETSLLKAAQVEIEALASDVASLRCARSWRKRVLAVPRAHCAH